MLTATKSRGRSRLAMYLFGDVRVQVCGDANRGLARSLGDDFQIDAGGEHQGGMTMTQPMEGELEEQLPFGAASPWMKGRTHPYAELRIDRLRAYGGPGSFDAT